MKKTAIILILSVAFIFTTQYSYGQTPEEHIANVSAVFTPIKESTWKYIRVVSQGKEVQKNEKIRQGLLSQYTIKKQNVLKLKQTTLRAAATLYLEKSMNVLKEDFDKILALEATSDQSYDLMEAYLLTKERAGDKLDEVWEEYRVAKKAYAASNNIELIDDKDKRAKKVEKASEALIYYNKVFLIYFKSYKAETSTLGASNAADVSGIEQNMQTLKISADEGLVKLKAMGSFKNYADLKTIAYKLMLFYKSEAEHDFPAFADFYLKKEAYEKARTEIDAIAKNDKTQADVDKYNTVADAYSNAIKIYNEKNNTMNAKRTTLFNEWNITLDFFFREYLE